MWALEDLGRCKMTTDIFSLLFFPLVLVQSSEGMEAAVKVKNLLGTMTDDSGMYGPSQFLCMAS